jgi:hypothetical protein
MHVRSMLKAGLLATVLFTAVPALAHAATDPAKDATPRPARTCFFLSDWEGWSAPDKDTLYIKVRRREVYRVDLAHGSNMLTAPSVYLVNVVRGTDQICHPLDLDLRVSDGFGHVGGGIPLMAKTITRLTPEQVAALPKKHRP